MKNYLIIFTTGLLLNIQAHAMAAKNAEAARSTTVARSEVNVNATDPSDVDASSANNTSPIPPLTEDDADDKLDKTLGKRGAMDRRMSEGRMSRDTTRTTDSVSSTTTPRSSY